MESSVIALARHFVCGDNWGCVRRWIVTGDDECYAEKEREFAQLTCAFERCQLHVDGQYRR